MAWAKSGSISVTNGQTTVSGNGTSWAEPAVKDGYILITADLKLYEITAVSGSEELTISPAYEGATNAAASYVIIPTKGSDVALNKAIEEFLARDRELLDDVENILTTLEGEFNTWLAARDGDFATALASYQGQVDGVLGGWDLSAIDVVLSGNVVDVCIDDSPVLPLGMQMGKSWYGEPLNTSTRGARRDMPATRVIVGYDDRVVIYDGDDPSLPMWMVFLGTYSWGNGRMLVVAAHNSAPLTSVKMENGVLCVGSAASGASGLHRIDLFKDGPVEVFANPRWIGNHSNIAQRNELLGAYVSGSSIVHHAVNDVAMTVRPDAPIDPATGLAVPTIDVITDGGVSTIHPDGSVLDISSGALNAKIAARDGRLFAAYSAYGVRADSRPNADTNDGLWGNNARYGQNVSNDHLQLLDANATALVATLSGFVHGSASGVTLVHENLEDASKGMTAFITSEFNTGWMPGDIKGAWLCDTDDTDLVGAELVTNGDFASGLTGWIDISEGSGSAVVSGGQMVLTNGGSYSDEGLCVQSFATEVGKTYILEVDVESGSLITQLGNSNGNNSIYQSGNNSDDITKTFVATEATTYLTFRAFSPSSNATINSASVRLATPDRSHNDNGLLIHGSIQAEPTVPSGEMVGYRVQNEGGIRNTFILPKGVQGNLGTVWTYELWVKRENSTTWDFLLHASGPSALHGRGIGWKSNYEWSIGGAGGVLGITDTQNQQVSLNDRDWQQLVFTCDGTDTRVYRNGQLVAEALGQVVDMTFPDDSYYWSFNGEDQHSSGVNVDGRIKRICMPRLSGAAKSADQILKSYLEEVGPVRHGLPSTLYGTSDAVNAIAHDKRTGLLHVGTSDGRSDFQGLTRVNHTTTAVNNAIAAHDGLIVED